MNFHGEINVSVHAMTLVAAQLSAVRGGAESECAQHRAARALQAVADGGEAGDDRLDDDLILIVAVTSQNDGTVAAEMFTHDTDLSKRGAAIADGA
jgi:hypothetical protein